MPLFRIETNISRDKIPKDFIKETSSLVAKILGKPEGYVVIHVLPDQMMTFGASDEPCANCYLMSIGKLGEQENISHSKALFEKVNKDLGIPKNRMYISFDDLPSFAVGHNGTTFYEIFGS